MPGKGLSKMCLGRLKKEYKKLQKNPVDQIRAHPLENNLLEWHYVLDGPAGSPYEGGYYHGLLRFPPEYPFKPPSILMYTPSGRFETNVRICLSMSDFHPESWNPMWSVSSILSGLLSFSELHFRCAQRCPIIHLSLEWKVGRSPSPCCCCLCVSCSVSLSPSLSAFLCLSVSPPLSLSLACVPRQPLAPDTTPRLYCMPRPSALERQDGGIQGDIKGEKSRARGDLDGLQLQEQSFLPALSGLGRGPQRGHGVSCSCGCGCSCSCGERRRRTGGL